MSSERTQKTNEKSQQSDIARRFMAIKEDKGVTWDEMALDLGLSKRTMQHYAWSSADLSAKILCALHGKYRVSLNWLYSGDGNMYLNADKTAQNEAIPTPEPAATVANARVEEPKNHYQTSKNLAEPLFPFLQTIDMTQFQDFFYVTAAALEQSLMEAGDRPGIDYTRQDIYRLALPIVVAEYQKNGLEINVFERGGAGT